MCWFYLFRTSRMRRRSRRVRQFAAGRSGGRTMTRCFLSSVNSSVYLIKPLEDESCASTNLCESASFFLGGLALS